MRLTVASYNIHKAVGIDRRRDPERILTILHEIGADIVALQEADQRFGSRSSCLPLAMIDDHGHYKAVRLDTRPGSIGWHGNAFLVAKSVEVLDAAIVPLPTIEPRGAVRMDALVSGVRVRAVGMHLDLSGIRRRQQIRAILAHAGRCTPPCPTVMMGDINEWSASGGALREFAPDYHVLNPGRSFHTRRPVAALDRIMISDGFVLDRCGVHHSALAARGSDHLPVWARLDIAAPA